MSKKILLLLSLLIIGIIFSGTLYMGYALTARGENIWLNLTDAQREAVRLKVQEMTKNGAASNEILNAVISMMQGWGITLPRLSFTREWVCRRLLRTHNK